MKKIYSVLMLSVLAIFFYSCKDSTPPKIFLDGDLVMEHILGKTFVDPGYTAIDDEDGDITDNVVVDSLNVNQTGTQVIKYTVSDAEGNTAEAARTVTVYNEARDFAGNWAGEYVYPYPSIDKKQYIDSIRPSTTENMVVIIKDFAGNSGAEVKGKIVLSGAINAPCVVFEQQTVAGKTFTATNAPITENNTKITVEYNLGEDKGVLVLVKQ